MMIYQVHERHGKHIAYNADEATRNEKAGWKTVSEKEFYKHTVKPPLGASDDSDDAASEAPAPVKPKKEPKAAKPAVGKKKSAKSKKAEQEE